jgi:DNA ligase-1
MQLARLCEALEAAGKTSSRNAKVSAIGDALVLAAKSGDDDLRTAVRLALGDSARLGAEGSAPGTLKLGWRTMMGALAARLGETNDAAIVEATRRLGDPGDAAEELVRKRNEPAPARPLALADVAELAASLRATSSRARRAALVTSTLARAGPLEVKFLVKALSGELRIGAAPGVVLLAIAKAFGAPEADVRRAQGLLADLAEVAVLAAGGRLDEATVKPGRPLAFMLATPIETIKTPIDLPAMVAEDKLDGVRAQVHVRAGDVTIFARGLDRVTDAFPEVAAAFAGAGDVVLDGEILAVTTEGRSRPFQSLQMRLNRKKPAAELVALVPVCFVAFDVLVRGDDVLVPRPWSERRAALEAIAAEVGATPAFVVKPAFAVDDAAALDAAFERARKDGNEGLVLKRKDAPYEAGKRGQAWIKVKKATATLDVVVTAAEQGHGKRAGVLSDYTFAVWKDGVLVDVGKAYSGLTDPEIDALSRHFDETTLEARGGFRRVAPDVVLEVGFDGIQRSDRHGSGFALRFPRILRVRSDKTIGECDTLETVEALFAAQVESGHREEPLAAPTPAKAREVRQLGLFDEPKRRR